jgi:hypothetical protein
MIQHRQHLGRLDVVRGKLVRLACDCAECERRDLSRALVWLAIAATVLIGLLVIGGAR